MSAAAQSEVWVRGHVPRASLDWLEMDLAHDADALVMLGESSSEAWAR